MYLFRNADSILVQAPGDMPAWLIPVIGAGGGVLVLVLAGVIVGCVVKRRRAGGGGGEASGDSDSGVPLSSRAPVSESGVSMALPSGGEYADLSHMQISSMGDANHQYAHINAIGPEMQSVRNGHYATPPPAGAHYASPDQFAQINKNAKQYLDARAALE